MDGSGIIYKQLGVWCYFNISSLDSSLRSLFWGEMINVPKSGKNVTVPSFGESSCQNGLTK